MGDRAWQQQETPDAGDADGADFAHELPPDEPDRDEALAALVAARQRDEAVDIAADPF